MFVLHQLTFFTQLFWRAENSNYCIHLSDTSVTLCHTCTMWDKNGLQGDQPSAHTQISTYAENMLWHCFARTNKDVIWMNANVPSVLVCVPFRIQGAFSGVQEMHPYGTDRPPYPHRPWLLNRAGPDLYGAISRSENPLTWPFSHVNHLRLPHSRTCSPCSIKSWRRECLGISTGQNVM